MNISPDGVTVRFKTEPKELFLAEKSGVKPNLLCLMDFDEWTLLKQHNPTKIIIQHQQEIFLRTLTNIHLEGEMLNTWIVTFSWTHEEHHQSLSNISYAHTMCFDRLDSFEKKLPGPHSVPFEQGDHRVGLQQEVESPTTCQAVEEPLIDERFEAITISNGTFALLQSIAHGRTLNMVINELYEEYMCTRAKERGPLHD